MSLVDDAVREAITESIKIQKETRELLKQGLIDQKEADSRLANAMQAVLFAETAAARVKNATANESYRRTQTTP